MIDMKDPWVASLAEAAREKIDPARPGVSAKHALALFISEGLGITEATFDERSGRGHWRLQFESELEAWLANGRALRVVISDAERAAIKAYVSGWGNYEGRALAAGVPPTLLEKVRGSIYQNKYHTRYTLKLLEAAGYETP